MDRIGPYEVVEEIARGGMGVVLRARDPRSGDPVAIKVLLGGDLANPLQQRRFKRESDALRRLTHENIVAIRDVGEHAGAPYLVMDLIEGETLEDRLERDGPFPPREAAELTRQLGWALEHAHAQSLLHRDVKPANVLIDTAGQPLLTDFGLVKDLDPDVSRLSRSGQFLGTPGYTPPEQARGALKSIGPHSDVYSLGATLYTLLTGESPARGETLLEIYTATQTVVPTPPSTLRPEVDPSLEAICMRCLEKDPLGRYATARALAQALERYLSGEVTAGEPREGTRPRPRRRVFAGLTLGVAAAAALVGGWTAGPDRAAAQELLDAATAARVAKDDAKAIGFLDLALEEDPSWSELWSRRAYYRRATGDIDGALADLEHLIGLTGSASAYSLLADALEERGDLKGAIAAYNQAIGLGARNQTIHNSLAQLFEKTGDDRAAIAEYSKAVALAPNALVPRMNRATACERIGDYDAAISDCDHALGVFPAYHYAFALRGKSKRKRGDLRSGLRDLNESLKLFDDPEIRFQRGRCLLELKDYSAAIRDFNEALAVHPDYVSALTARGLARARTGNLMGGRDDYSHALQQLPAGSANADLVRNAIAQIDDELNR